MTDCHAQLNPVYFREPSVNLGIGNSFNKVPHLVGQHFLNHFNIQANSNMAHAFTSLDFVSAAKTFGKVGGFAHLKTLVDQLRGNYRHRKNTFTGRWRHLARVGNRLLDERYGHGGSLQFTGGLT